MEPFSVYKDIQARTRGQFLVGVVGPVRTGKSTFIRRFMELLALPAMDEQTRREVKDQLPVSGSGKTITTVEPKFIPKEAVEIHLGEDIPVKIRLIDCVGFLVKDAGGAVGRGITLDDHMRTSLIRRQASRATGPITDADIAYLVEETNSSTEFVRNVLKELGY